MAELSPDDPLLKASEEGLAAIVEADAKTEEGLKTVDGWEEPAEPKKEEKVVHLPPWGHRRALEIVLL